MSFSRFMVKKPIKTIQQESVLGELKRSLSALNLISLGIGCIIGTGIFVMTGQAAALYAGPSIVLSFVLAGVCCAFTALCYAELAAMLPVSGSAYSYSYASMGEAVAWIMGWLLLLEYGVASAMVAVGWSGYIVSFLRDFNIIIPLEWANSTGFIATDPTTGEKVTGIFNTPAFLAISVLTTLLIAGVRESANVNNVIVLIKGTVIILFIAFGAMYINPDNWHPFIPENTGTYGEFGWSGIVNAASFIFFSYVGFEAVSTASQEAKNPQRDIPIGIIGSLVVCTILYILVSGVLTGIVSYKILNVPDPIAVAVDAIGLPWLSFVVKIGAIAGLSSVMLVLMYGQTRIFYTMAKDGLLPKVFARVHPTRKTPWVNTIVVGVLSGLAAGFVDINALSNLVNLGTLIAFALICFTVIYLRIKEPKMDRPFKVPYPKITPLLGIGLCLVLISSLWATFLHLIPYFAIGFMIYFGYGSKKSNLADQTVSPKMANVLCALSFIIFVISMSHVLSSFAE